MTMTPYRSKTVEGTYYFLVHGTTWGSSVQGVVLVGVESYSAIETEEGKVVIDVKWQGIEESDSLQFKVPIDSWEVIEVSRLDETGE
jgi:hypothetical protein